MLSQYELDRLDNIARNKAVLEANDNKDWKHVTLGALESAKRTLKTSVPAALKKRLDLAIVKLQPKGEGKFV